jgi:ribosomal protein S21
MNDPKKFKPPPKVHDLAVVVVREGFFEEALKILRKQVGAAKILRQLIDRKVSPSPQSRKRLKAKRSCRRALTRTKRRLKN